jgi:hypothetical protein
MKYLAFTADSGRVLRLVLGQAVADAPLVGPVLTARWRACGLVWRRDGATLVAQPGRPSVCAMYNCELTITHGSSTVRAPIFRHPATSPARPRCTTAPLKDWASPTLAAHAYAQIRIWRMIPPFSRAVRVTLMVSSLLGGEGLPLLGARECDVSPRAVRLALMRCGGRASPRAAKLVPRGFEPVRCVLVGML